MLGKQVVTQPPDPIFSILWGYSEYIIVGFGILMILVFIRRFLVPWYRERGELTNGTKEE